MRTTLEDNKLYAPKIESLFRLGGLTQVLGAGFTVDEDSPPILNFDPDGSTRIITFPAPSSYNEGAIWLVNNWAGGAEDLTINNSAAGTIGTISQNEAALVFIVGGVTYCRMVGATT